MDLFVQLQMENERKSSFCFSFALILSWFILCNIYVVISHENYLQQVCLKKMSNFFFRDLNYLQKKSDIFSKIWIIFESICQILTFLKIGT